MTSVAAPGGGKRAADRGHEYVEFPGLILTDTFQSWEDDDRQDLDVFPENNERLERLKKLPITVIVGNPPYSSGQDSRQRRQREREVPVARRADPHDLRRALDGDATRTRSTTPTSAPSSGQRCGSRTAASLPTSPTAAGSTPTPPTGCARRWPRSSRRIYVLNLRGNQRTAGEQSRKEGGKVFGGGSRATVAITLLVENPAKHGPATIHYTDIGDYLTARAEAREGRGRGSTLTGLDARHDHAQRARRLAQPASRRLRRASCRSVTAGEAGIFDDRSLGGLNQPRRVGLQLSTRLVEGDRADMLDATVDERRASSRQLRIDDHDKRSAGSRSLRRRAARADARSSSLISDVRQRSTGLSPSSVCTSTAAGSTRAEQLRRLFPTSDTPNIGIYVIGARLERALRVSSLTIDCMPDLHLRRGCGPVLRALALRACCRGRRARPRRRRRGRSTATAGSTTSPTRR